MSEFATYQQFFSAEEAEPIIAILNEHGIPFTFKQNLQRVDSIIAGETYNEPYDLRIPANEFERVTELLLANTKVNLDELDKDNYLFSFTDEELYNVIKNPDEWGRQDYLVAAELLKQRGQNVSNEKLKELRKEKLDVLAKPEKKIATLWITITYILPIWALIRAWLPVTTIYTDINGIRIWSGQSDVLMFMAGVIAMIVGISLWRFKKLLPDGNRVYRFLPVDRKHGKIIFFLGVFSSLSVLLSFLYFDATGDLPFEIFN